MYPKQRYKLKDCIEHTADYISDLVRDFRIDKHDEFCANLIFEISVTMTMRFLMTIIDTRLSDAKIHTALVDMFL